jgi:hypothetical protein
MPASQAFLDALEEAYFSGASSVSYEGKSVTYRSRDEMLAIIGDLRKLLGLPGMRTTALAAHSRGYGWPGSDG